MIFTDEWRAYESIGPRFKQHHRINHTAKIHVEGNVHTNTVEGFFGMFKTSVKGVYKAVSARYLQNYLDEYAWRYNHRFDERPMFWTILDAVRPSASAA